MRKWMLLLGGLVVLGLTASLAFVAGQVVSPEQKAAMVAPPTVTVATAVVEERVIVMQQVGRASVVFANPKKVTLPSDESGDVVTHTYLKAGKKIRAGSVLIEIAGHPVLAFPAPFSPYRTLSPGMSGRDVQVLRKALRAMGLATSSRQALQPAELARLDRWLQDWGYRLPQIEVASEPVETKPAVEAEGDATPAPSAPAKPKKVFTLPASWWVGIKKLPATVASKGPGVGAHLSDTSASLTITSGAPLLKATLPTNAAEVTEGMSLTFTIDEAAEHSWTVDSATLDSTEESAMTTQLLIETNEKIPTELINATGKIVIGATDERKELAVPLTAVSAGTDGNPAIRVKNSDGKVAEVSVTLGTQAEGWVAITPLVGSVAAGAEVILG